MACNLSNITTTLESIQKLYEKSNSLNSTKFFIIPETGNFCEYQAASLFEGFLKIFHDATPKLTRTYSHEAGDSKKFIERCLTLEHRYKKSIRKCAKNLLWNASCKEKEQKNEKSKIALVEIYKHVFKERKQNQHIPFLVKAFDKDEHIEHVEKALCSLFKGIENEIHEAVQKTNINLEFYLNLQSESLTQEDVIQIQELTQLPEINQWTPPTLLERKMQKKKLPSNEMVASINIKGLISQQEAEIESLRLIAQQLTLLFPKLEEALKWTHKLVIDIDSVTIVENQKIERTEFEIPPPPPPESLCISNSPSNDQEDRIQAAIKYCNQQKENEKVENDFCEKYKQLIEIIFFNEIKKGYLINFQCLPSIEELQAFIDKTIDFNQKHIDELLNTIPTRQLSKIKLPSELAKGYPPLLSKIQELRKKIPHLKKQFNLITANKKAQQRLGKINEKMITTFTNLQKEQESIVIQANKNKKQIKKALNNSENIQQFQHQLNKSIDEQRLLIDSMRINDEMIKESEKTTLQIEREINLFTQCEEGFAVFEKKCTEYTTVSIETQKEIYQRLYPLKQKK